MPFYTSIDSKTFILNMQVYVNMSSLVSWSIYELCDNIVICYRRLLCILITLDNSMVILLCTVQPL